MAKKEVFFSIDIETDGPIPIQNSMLSFGCVAFDSEFPGRVLGTFSRNLLPLPGAHADPRTMKEFWELNPKAWEAATTNQVPAAEAMTDFVNWVKSFDECKHVAVCSPAGFDYTFMYVYMIMFAGESPFSFSCLDLKSYASAMLKTSYRNSGKRSWPKRWFHPELKHTHVALDDAMGQGFIFSKMRNELLFGLEASKECDLELTKSLTQLREKE